MHAFSLFGETNGTQLREKSSGGWEQAADESVIVPEEHPTKALSVAGLAQ